MNNFLKKSVILLITPTALVALFTCGLADPDDAFEPLPPPDSPPHSIIDPYYLDEEGQVSLIPDLTIRQSGVTSGGFPKMDIEIAVEIDNRSQEPYEIEPAKVTVYTPRLPNFLEIGTAELIPVHSEGTQQQETVPPGERVILFYDNNPLDELSFDPTLDADFFAVFLLVINGQEQPFVTNLTTF